MQEFNEVYFTDVVIPDHQRLGAVGDGWNVSLTTLMNERMSIGSRLAPAFRNVRVLLEPDDGKRPAIDDRATRSKLANWAVKASGLKYTSYRAVSSLSKGERPGPENSIGKLVAGSMLQDIAAYAMDLEGAAGALTGAAEEVGAAVPADALESPSMRIAGGTDEILRNIIAERVGRTSAATYGASPAAGRVPEIDAVLTIAPPRPRTTATRRGCRGTRR